MVKNLKKSFGEPILGGVSLEVRKGEVIGIVGPNGTGKSTLVKILAGAERPDSGEIIIGGTLAVAYQEDYLLPWKRIRDNVCLPLKFKGEGCSPEELEELAERLGLIPYLNLYPKEVSGGTRRKAAILRAVLMDADVTVLDEPFTGLDTDSVGELLSLIDELRERGKTFIVVSHQLEELFRIADRVYVLSGRPAVVKKTIGREERGKGAL
nr:ATP-binding cassette domain-containing protein [Thermococcus sp. Bubb.Bath]